MRCYFCADPIRIPEVLTFSTTPQGIQPSHADCRDRANERPWYSDLYWPSVSEGFTMNGGLARAAARAAQEGT